MSITKIYEWLTQKYPEYQYTKCKICKVLRCDSKRKCPQFVIDNIHQLAGVLLHWTIQPGIEAQLH